MTAVTVRLMDSGDPDSGDTSGGERLSARWSDLHPDIPLARYPVHALASGLVRALVWAGVAALLLWFLDMPWHDALTIAGAGGAATLVLLTVVALAVSFLGFRAARRSRRTARSAAEAARRVAEADRMRAVLLATLSHDLRSPIAAAKTAVSGLRAADIRLTADDRGELLAAADESLDQLARLTASLLDMSRLQAGKLSVFPRPAVLRDIVGHALDDVGPRSVMVRVPAGLPEVVADPALLERVIVNLARNALRYSPPGTPPQLTARARGGRVELRVIDRGPGIPRTERDRAFLPFQRLGDTSTSPGVGLGLALSRGLTEAMGGTLDPRETPGGGLTMVISLPVARSTARGVTTDKLLAAIGACTGSGDRPLLALPRRRCCTGSMSAERERDDGCGRTG